MSNKPPLSCCGGREHNFSTICPKPRLREPPHEITPKNRFIATNNFSSSLYRDGQTLCKAALSLRNVAIYRCEMGQKRAGPNKPSQMSETRYTLGSTNSRQFQTALDISRQLRPETKIRWQTEAQSGRWTELIDLEELKLTTFPSFRCRFDG